MKLTFFNISLLLFVVVLCIYSLFNKKQIAEFKMEIYNLKECNSELNKSAVGQYWMNTARLKNRLMGANHNIIDINSLGLNNPVVFFFEESSCNPCIKRELTELVKLAKTKRDILILAKYQNPRLMEILMREYGIEKNAYALDIEEPIFLEVNDQPTTVLFVLNRLNYVENAYIPSPNNPILSEYYFKSIKDQKL